MSILGIITEYNPFHYGHLYHLHKGKEISNSDTVICIMNGNFVQRGKLAFMDKWSRTKMALANGVDLVIELPLIYGIRSAEYFSDGAIQLLEASGIVKKLVFGSEAGDISLLKKASQILKEEDQYFQDRLQNYLTTGKSFPHARSLALKDFLHYQAEENEMLIEELEKTLMEPNNILGIEYLKSLEKIKSKIEPFTIQRKGSAYHQQNLDQIASATAIRKKIQQEGYPAVKEYLPEESYKIIQEEFQKNKIELIQDHFSMMMLANLRKRNPEELLQFAEIENGLENRILEQAQLSANLSELLENIKTKAFTQTRIQRNLLHIFFDIKKSDFQELDKHGPQYIRVLGVKKGSENLLSKLDKEASLPVVINPAQFIQDINPASKNPLIKSLSYDIIASDIYSLLYKDTKLRQGRKDFSHPLIKI
ncbi:MAG: nucleotidyltransferase [bacterium]